jgi:drug/metabolite transporter (DMT)-like permease
LTLAYVGSLAYLTVFGSIVAFGAYLTLLGRIGAHKAGYAMVMFPVVALVLSTLFEGLEIDTTTVIGTLLVLSGNLFVLKTRRGTSASSRDSRYRWRPGVRGPGELSIWSRSLWPTDPRSRQ